MSRDSFAKIVNSTVLLINGFTPDPAERLGIASALLEVYRHELCKSIVPYNQPEAPKQSPHAGEVDITV